MDGLGTLGLGRQRSPNRRRSVGSGTGLVRRLQRSRSALGTRHSASRRPPVPGGSGC